MLGETKKEVESPLEGFFVELGKVIEQRREELSCKRTIGYQLKLLTLALHCACFACEATQEVDLSAIRIVTRMFNSQIVLAFFR